MAITQTQWARLYAKAWCESTQPKPTTFQDDLERNPFKAIDAVRSQFGIGRADKIIDLDYDHDPVAEQLRDSAKPELLLAVIKSGNLNGQQMSRGTWIRPNPLEEITLPVRAVNPAISLADWTRIYAYIWYQYLKHDVETRGSFEKDPASTLPKIVAGIKNLCQVDIDYNQGVTRLLDLGLPPKKDADPQLLSSIENDPDAKQYRYKATLTC